MCWGQFEMVKIILRKKAQKFLFYCGNEKNMLSKLNKIRCERCCITLKHL